MKLMSLVTKSRFQLVCVKFVLELSRVGSLMNLKLSQMGLCVGLAFTFPIMMHPIHEILEGKLTESRWFQKLCKNDMQERFWMYLCRALLVVLSAVMASFVPGFGVFVSFVGSTVCALLSFVLPAMFHLILMGSSLRFWQRALDICIFACGLAFAAHGTYRAAVGLSPGSS